MAHLAAFVLTLAAHALQSAASESPASRTDSGACWALETGVREQYKGPTRSARVRLVWHSAPAQAAAALVRATLIAAGHRRCDVTLQYSRDAADLCTLLNAPDEGEGEGDRAVVVVGVAVAASAASGPCKLTGSALQVLAWGGAPVEPRLHARLAAPWVDEPACRAELTYPALSAVDAAPLRRCGFLPAGTEDNKNATVYIPEREWQRETKDLQRQLEGARLRYVPVPRDQLLGSGNRSFLFFDADLWRSTRGVFQLPAPPDTAPHRRSYLVADRNALLKHAPKLFLMLFNGTFAPPHGDLRAVLERAAATNESAEDAACRHVSERIAGAQAGANLTANAADNGPGLYNQWKMQLQEASRRLAIAVLCTSEIQTDYQQDSTFQKVAFNYLYNDKLFELKATLDVEVVFVDCADPSALAVQVVKWRSDGSTWRTVGVAAPAELAIRAAYTVQAERLALPLVAYTPSAEAAEAAEAGVGSVTGSPGQLARAVRRLLAACRWRRLGVVSEDTPLARAVHAALVHDAGLLTHQVSAAAPAAALQELHDLDTRVFFVNADAAVTARVLAAAATAAASLPSGITSSHVWIMRDYEAPDDVTARLEPVSVSYQWRGGVLQGSPAPNTAILRRCYKESWLNRTWPRHAASLLDALATIGTGFERRVKEDNTTLDYPDNNMPRYFWNGVEKKKIPGVIEDLKYVERSVVKARVYVEWWSSRVGVNSVRPRVVAEWHATDGEQVGEACPVPELVGRSDGRSGCLVPAGAPYKPRCLDAAWAGGAAALALTLAALALAAVALRRWVARRDRRLERATTVKILAQREAAFAELAPHLVDPAALVLGEEVGAGRFGRVRRGEVRGGAARRCTPVAVKALRDGASPAEESQFLREARLLAALDHEHVVRFAGVSWEGGPPLLLMELALFGDLLRYLRARRHLAEGAGGLADGAGARAEGEEAAAVSPEALTRLAREAAEALAYLGSRGLVHRDVRAANCLVDARRSLKLADFGLARETGAADGEYACRGRALFPVLWMAPESLARGVATAASDAWSFGVLALELVTLGARPFGGAAPEAAVRAVLAGGRPPLPRDACAETRALALACWRREPGARPPARRLAAWLARRPSALRPALAADLEEPECDSGIGEPDPRPHPHPHPHRYTHADTPAPDDTNTRRSISLVTLAS